MAQIIDGKLIAANFREEIAIEVAKIKKEHEITPTLAVILVGCDPASEVYVSNKEKTAHSVGMNSIQFKFSAETTQKELIAKIDELNNDPKIHGILVQLPLPSHINSKAVIHNISPLKDVDGFTIENVGKLSIGDIKDDENSYGAIVPCTPLACLHLIKNAVENSSVFQRNIGLTGLKALVIGASNIVGRPLARLLMLEGCTVTIANRSTRNLSAETLQADIIIVATGVVNLLKKEMVKKGAIIIDVGINRVKINHLESKIVGDVDFDQVKKVASAITPVPGGVGPMTIAYLLQNTIKCCLRIIKNNQ